MFERDFFVLLSTDEVLKVGVNSLTSAIIDTSDQRYNDTRFYIIIEEHRHILSICEFYPNRKCYLQKFE